MSRAKTHRHAACAAASHHEVNGGLAVFFRFCFLVYIGLVFGTFVAAFCFLQNMDWPSLMILLGTIVGVGAMRYVGFAHLDFDKCETDLDAAFVSPSLNVGFERWFARLQSLLEEGENGDVWKRHAVRQKLIRECRTHPQYLRKTRENGVEPPPWLM